MKKICIAVFLLSAASIIHGAAHEPTYKTFNCQDITSNNIYDLTNQASQVPVETHDQLNQWLAQPNHKKLLAQLLKFEFKTLQELCDKKDQDNQALIENGTPNESKWNYVFEVPKLGYHIKIAGPVNRVQSALMEHGIWPGQKAEPDVLEQILAGKTKTYQTTSRAAYFLTLKELLAHNRLDRIKTPETHLIYAPGAPKSAHDDNVFILEKNLPKEGTVLLTEQNAKDLSDETISQLVQAIIGSGLWAIKDNVYIENSTKNLYIVDLEQPNNSAPKDFFHQDKIRYDGNITSGLEQLIDMLAGDQNKLSLVRALIDTSPIIQAPNYNARYKRELDAMLNKKVPAPPQSQQPIAQE